MNLSSFDAVFLAAGFLVPGFVWSAVLSMLVPRRATGSEVRFLEFFTFSCINHGLWSWAFFLIFKTNLSETHPYWSSLALAGIIFLSPIGLGLLSGWLGQKQKLARLFGRLGFRTVHAIPTAWDWHFSQAKPLWALVRLKDGSEVCGLFGPQSFAASDPQKRDLFLEATFQVVDTGDWAPVEDTAGVLIMADEIATIEFRKLAEVEYE